MTAAEILDDIPACTTSDAELDFPRVLYSQILSVNASRHLIKKTSIGNREAASGSNWEPNTDVYTADSRLVINVELAGMRREDLELCIDGNQLIISGQRPDCGRPSGCSFLVMEIHYGPFTCAFELPEGYDLTDAVAAYQNGFLKIEVPQAARPKSERRALHLAEE